MNSLFKNTALKMQAVLTDFDKRVKSGPMVFSTARHYPVFILGAPRSGSTLLYQLVLRYLEAGYISNIMALAPIKMVTLAERLQRYHSLTSVKASNFGYIDGLFSPSEAGAIQRFWFDDDLSSEQAVWVRNTFVILSQIFNNPVIIKNLFNTVRLECIRSLLPEARFIYIERDPLFNAQSLLKARRKINDSEHIWWSIKPDGYEKVLNREPEYQVIWQVLETEKKIKRFFHSNSLDYFHIHYEKLCADPDGIITDIAAWMNLSLKKRINIDEIRNSNVIRTPVEKWSKLSDCYSILQTDSLKRGDEKQ